MLNLVSSYIFFIFPIVIFGILYTIINKPVGELLAVPEKDLVLFHETQREIVFLWVSGRVVHSK